jgi:hypothetical protein
MANDVLNSIINENESNMCDNDIGSNENIIIISNENY